MHAMWRMVAEHLLRSFTIPACYTFLLLALAVRRLGAPGNGFICWHVQSAAHAVHARVNVGVVLLELQAATSADACLQNMPGRQQCSQDGLHCVRHRLENA